jgi:hypothetical protein
MKTGFQKDEILTISRRGIKNAPYNPREISEENLTRLKKGIKRHGLVATITWNRRSGNVVGGHQRLAALDALEKNQDYELHVSAIDVDEHEEKMINVQLNNNSMMGDWDLPALETLLQDVDFADAGFTASDIDILFEGGMSEFYTDAEPVAKDKETLRDIKQNRKEYAEKMKAEQSANYYFIVVCESAEEKAEIYKRIGAPMSEEYISSAMIKRLGGKVRLLE